MTLANLQRNWPVVALIVALLVGAAAPLALGMGALHNQRRPR